jgi:hypothetical protein
MGSRGAGVDGGVLNHRHSRPVLEVSALREVVLRYMVLQQEFSR